MLRLDKAWSLRELPECHRPTCDEHCRAPGDASDGDTATDGAASGTAALPAGAGGREGDGYTRSNKPCGVTREISLPPEQGGCRIAVVGVEHDGLLLLARYWPRCTEVGYVRGVSAEAYQRIEGFQLLHRSPGHTWIVHASLSSNMCFLGLTVWQPVFAEEGGAEGSGVSAAPKQTVESEGPYQAFVLRVDAPVPPLPEPEPESGPPQRAAAIWTKNARKAAPTAAAARRAPAPSMATNQGEEGVCAVRPWWDCASGRLAKVTMATVHPAWDLVHPHPTPSRFADCTSSPGNSLRSTSSTALPSLRTVPRAPGRPATHRGGGQRARSFCATRASSTSW
jgi:hypothetical protein